MTAFLASVSPVEWLSIAAASWLIAGCVAAVPIGRVMRRADRRPQPVDPYVDREGTRYLPTYPPKVYPSRPADLLSDQPAEVAPSEWDRRFFAIVDRETHWFMDGAA